MKKGTKHSEKTKNLMKESNKDSIKRALEIKLQNHINKHPSRKTNPYLYIKSRNLLRDFGITLSDYNKMFTKQNGRCAICNIHQSEIKGMKALGVDHNHNTNKIRGLLCDSCNRGLGLFNDSPELLENAKEYLEGGGEGRR